MDNSQVLISRITALLEAENITPEMKRFGGFDYFMSGGKVICSVFGEKLMMRCKPELLDDVLKHNSTGIIPDAEGNPVKDCFLLLPEGFDTDDKLKSWLKYGIEFAKQGTFDN